MVSLMQLWLPILLGAVGVFVASSLLHMVIRAWHSPDYHGFSNEDEVRAAMRKGSPAPGMYMVPWCPPEKMKDPAMMAKFTEGPVAFAILKAPGMFNMGKSLGAWFGFCLVMTLFAAYVAGSALPAGTEGMQVFRIAATAAFMGFGLGGVPNWVWWGEPTRSMVKFVIDGLIYACIVGAILAGMWPHPVAA